MRLILQMLMYLIVVASVSSLERITVSAGGIDRTALVHIPKTGALHPLVIAYHGAGKTSENFQATTSYEQYWPEAVVVYPQGLAGGTGERLNPDGKLTGWQTRPRADQDRDVKFFDQLVDAIAKVADLDLNRIYVTGQSNGGGHTFLLWLARGSQIAAFAPCSSQAPLDTLSRLIPRPFFMISGKLDVTVPFPNQLAVQERLKARFESLGIDCQTYIHEGGHELPKDGPERVVSFFKRVDRENGQMPDNR